VTRPSSGQRLPGAARFEPWETRFEPWERGLTRRAFLARSGTAGALVALGGGLLSACTREEERVPRKTGATPTEDVIGIVPGPQPVEGGQYGGRVSSGYIDGPGSLDPHLAGNFFDYDVTTILVFFGALYGYGGQTGGPIPNIAAEMPDISQDRLTFTIPIKQGIKFHNGRELTAEDVKWSMERMLFPETGSWGIDYINSIVGWDEVVDGKTKELEGVEVVDSYTVRITLKRPDVMILNALALNMTTPVPREEVERLGDQFGVRPVGHGPFKIEEVDEAGQRIFLSRFEDYYWEELPYVDEVELRWGLDPNVMLRQLQSGDLDMLGEGIPPEQVGRVQGDPQLQHLAIPISINNERYARMNLRSAPLDDVRVRQALNYGINREDFAKVLFGNSLPWGSPLPEGVDVPRGDYQGYTYDPERARALLSEAGYGEGGLQLKLVVPEGRYGPAIGQISQENLRELGVELDLEVVNGDVIGDIMETEDWQMVASSWIMIQPEPADVIDNIYLTDAPSNTMGYSNPDVDRLAREARQEFDDARRGDLYAQIEQMIAEDAPALWFDTESFVAGKAEPIQNYHFRGDLGQYFDRLWVQV
jgi:peptide/nickel transport system substrate-binding protein